VKLYYSKNVIYILLPIIVLLGVLMVYLNRAKNTTTPPVSAEYHGIWGRSGYGEVISITDKGGEFYQYTRETCIKVDTIDSANVAQLFAETEYSPDANTRRRIPNEFHLFSWSVRKLNDLPAVCQPDNLIVANTPTQTFEHLWHTFNDYYAFFAERNIDWDEHYANIRPTVADDMSDDELLVVFKKLLAPVNDGHIELSTTDDAFNFYEKRGVDKFMIEQSSKQSDFEDFQQYANWFSEQFKEVLSNYFNIDAGGSAGGNSGEEITWASNDSGVGYLHIGTMLDIADKESASESEILEAVNSIMESALADLQQTDTLIIDVRFNSGGHDAVSLAIANHFTDQSSLAYSKHTHSFTGETYTAEAFLSPATSSPYLKPIAILTSPNTASAAEVFLMIMSELSHVSLVGEHSAGVLADSRPRALPNRWIINVPNGDFVSASGGKYEVRGVPPDIQISANYSQLLEQRRDHVLEAAL